RVQNTLRQVLNDDLTTAQKHIEITGHAIRKDKAEGDHLVFLDESAKARALAQSPGEAAKIDLEVEARTRSLERSTLLDHKDATKQLLKYKQDVLTYQGVSQITADPDQFTTDYKAGKYAGLDPTRGDRLLKT